MSTESCNIKPWSTKIHKLDQYTQRQQTYETTVTEDKYTIAAFETELGKKIKFRKSPVPWPSVVSKTPMVSLLEP